MISLRPATMDDAALLLAWRNEPATVALSRARLPIPYKEHMLWLAGKLADDKCQLFIAEHEGVPIGMVRLDGSEIGVAVAPEHRNKGFAKQIIDLVCSGFNGTITATIRRDNPASIRLFTACGFVHVGDVGSAVLRYQKVSVHGVAEPGMAGDGIVGERAASPAGP